MNAHTPIAASVTAWSTLKARLVEEFGLDPEDPVISDTLDGELDLVDRLASMLRHARERSVFAKALGDMIDEMRARKQRLEQSSAALRDAAASAALDAGIPKIERPDLTASFRVGPQSLKGEADPASLPDDLCRSKREINRSAVKEAIEAGREVPGFWLGNGSPTVTVRVK